MKRLGLILMIAAMIGLPAYSWGQVLTNESIGFKWVVRDKPGDTVAIPIFLQNDSVVSGISFLFEFNHNILHPIIAFNPDYQELLDSAEIDPTYTPPESTEYQATPAYDPGLWELSLNISSTIDDYGWVNPPQYTGPSHPTWAIKSVFYNLNARDSVRLLMAPNFVDSFYVANTPGYIRPHIPGGLVYKADTLGVIIGYLRFVVDPGAQHGDQSFLHTTRNVPQSYRATELAEEWHDPAGSPDAQTVSVYPQNLLSTVFVVDTTDTGGGPEPDENNPPVLATITPNVYNIMAAEQVSFNVTASDAEGGLVTIRCNNGNLSTANATFGINGVVTGAGGVATGTFSFMPDLSQVGTYAFTFQATDDSGATSAAQAVTVTVEGIDEDILFTMSAEDFFPSGGVPGLDEVIVPINVISEKKIFGIQFDLQYNANYFDLDSIFTSDRIPDWVVFDNSSQPGDLRVITFGLANDSMVPGSSSAVIYLAFTVDEFAVAGCYDLIISNAWESIDPNPTIPSLEMVTESGILCVDLWGDVNLDRRVNVADLVNVVAYIINNYDLNKRRFAAGDVVANDSVNVVDLVGIINIIFGLPVSPLMSPPVPDGAYATVGIQHGDIPGGLMADMAIKADVPVGIAGVELDVSYNPGLVQMFKPQLTDASKDFIIYSSDDGRGRLKILIHSEHPWSENELIAQGVGDIIRIPVVSRGNIMADDDRVARITRAVMSTGGAKNVQVEGVNPDPVLPDKFELYQNRPNPFNPQTFIDFYIEGSPEGNELVRLEIFNILGQQVRVLVDQPLPPGYHTVVWDGTDNDGSIKASGVYLYRLKVGEANKTRKMVLLK